MMFFAFGALGVVVSAGPERVLNRLRGKFVKRLAKELWAEVAPADAKLFTTAFDERSNAREAQQFIGGLPATTIGTEGRGQARGMDETRARQGREQLIVLMS